MKKFIKNKKGFTLVELVVVIAILAILALILIPSVSGYVSSAELAKKEANARTLYMSATLANETEEAASKEAKAFELAGITKGTGDSIDFTADPITVTLDGVTFNGKVFTGE